MYCGEQYSLSKTKTMEVTRGSINFQNKEFNNLHRSSNIRRETK
jgi:hypothetical protein